jgi:hypothetical protein
MPVRDVGRQRVLPLVGATPAVHGERKDFLRGTHPRSRGEQQACRGRESDVSGGPSARQRFQNVGSNNERERWVPCTSCSEEKHGSERRAGAGRRGSAGAPRSATSLSSHVRSISVTFSASTSPPGGSREGGWVSFRREGWRSHTGNARSRDFQKTAEKATYPYSCDQPRARRGASCAAARSDRSR